MKKIYIGIDNGVSGGLVALLDCSGVDPIAMRVMPTQKRRNRDEVDIKELYKWCSEVAGDDLANVVFVIEEPGGSKSAKAATMFCNNAWDLAAVLEDTTTRTNTS